jgi:hypothetical protein
VIRLTAKPLALALCRWVCTPGQGGKIYWRIISILSIHTISKFGYREQKNPFVRECIRKLYVPECSRTQRGELHASCGFGSNNTDYNAQNDQHNEGDATLLSADGFLYPNGLHHLRVALVDILLRLFHLVLDLVQ